MAVRNFWLEADIDGRKTPLKGGPRRKDGGFTLTIKQRDYGGIITAYKIDGITMPGDGLKVVIHDDEGNLIGIRSTIR